MAEDKHSNSEKTADQAAKRGSSSDQQKKIDAPTNPPGSGQQGTGGKS